MACALVHHLVTFRPWRLNLDGEWGLDSADGDIESISRDVPSRSRTATRNGCVDYAKTGWNQKKVELPGLWHE